MILINTIKAKAILGCLSSILAIIEYEKHNMSMESYRIIRRSINSIAKDLYGADGVTKLEASALRKVGGNKRCMDS